MKKRLLYEYSGDFVFRKLMDDSNAWADDLSKRIKAEKASWQKEKEEHGKKHWENVYRLLQEKGLMNEFKTVEEFMDATNRSHNINIDDESKCVFLETLEEGEDDSAFCDDPTHNHGKGGATIASGVKEMRGKDLKALLKALGIEL